jgi:hypothetical protein
MIANPVGAARGEWSTIVSREEFMDLARPLVGLPVSLARQRMDGTLLIDLGSLRPASGPRRGVRGEVALVLEGDWRFEVESGVLFGSSSTEAFVYAQLLALAGQTVTAFSLAPELPELAVELSQGIRAHSFACNEGGPRWSLWLPDDSWLYCEDGALHHEPAGRGDVPRLSEIEEAKLARSEDAAERWGERASTASGRCAGCECFIRLDGFGKFGEYGVCSSPRSLQDGRLVSLRSGCAAFAAV